jgi:hypothetical protein
MICQNDTRMNDTRMKCQNDTRMIGVIDGKCVAFLCPPTNT